MQDQSDLSCLSQSHQLTIHLLNAGSGRILPHTSTIQTANNTLISVLPDEGRGIRDTTKHILEDLAPALNHQALSPFYYGFVTGGITPAARVAEEVVSTYDQNVLVHLPEASIATTVEDRALKLLLQLFDLKIEEWPGRTFTTGATSSNVTGLACGRERIINEAIRKREMHTAGQNSETLGELGLLVACRRADITDVQVLTTLPHSSLKKASSIIGLGRSCFPQVSRSPTEVEFDLDLVEKSLKQPCTASIVVVSCAEVNTGLFATHGREEVRALRALCDKYGAWLHVDAAFGLFARVLEDSDEFSYVRNGAMGLDLADSIGEWVSREVW